MSGRGGQGGGRNDRSVYGGRGTRGSGRGSIHYTTTLNENEFCAVHL